MNERVRFRISCVGWGSVQSSSADVPVVSEPDKLVTSRVTKPHNVTFGFMFYDNKVTILHDLCENELGVSFHKGQSLITL